MATDADFPNLKICIDNTDSREASPDVVSLHENQGNVLDIESTGELSSEPEEGEIEPTFNVRLGKIKKGNQKVNKQEV